MESRLSDDWRESSSWLISHRVKYLLAGAHALAVHGRARVTLDDRARSLIATKLASGRPKDLLHLELLHEPIRSPKLNRARRGAPRAPK